MRPDPVPLGLLVLAVSLGAVACTMATLAGVVLAHRAIRRRYP